MPLYYFRTLERDGRREVTEVAAEFFDVAAAEAEARETLAQMAIEGLPDPSINLMAVEVLNEDRRPISEVRLTIETIPKTNINAVETD